MTYHEAKRHQEAQKTSSSVFLFGTIKPRGLIAAKALPRTTVSRKLHSVGSHLAHPPAALYHADVISRNNGNNIQGTLASTTDRQQPPTLHPTHGAQGSRRAGRDNGRKRNGGAHRRRTNNRQPCFHSDAHNCCAQSTEQLLLNCNNSLVGIVVLVSIYMPRYSHCIHVREPIMTPSYADITPSHTFVYRHDFFIPHQNLSAGVNTGVTCFRTVSFHIHTLK